MSPSTADLEQQVAAHLDKFREFLKQGGNADTWKESPPAGVDSEKLLKWMRALQAIHSQRRPHSPTRQPQIPRRFRDLNVLGQGGFGIVYSAWDETLSRNVALKFVNRSPRTNPEEFEQFGAEARAVARLNHPHIVTIHDFQENEGRPFFVMELAESSLETRLRDKAMGEKEAAALLANLTRAIQHAHGKGIKHRDLKPANVLLVSGVAKIADFGLCLRSDEPEIMGNGGGVTGTDKWRSPEQAQGDKGDERSDVYGLGALLYAMLTGGSPPPSPQGQLHKGSESLAAIVKKCLETRPDDRYQAAQDLANDLDRFALDGLPPRWATVSVREKARLWYERNWKWAWPTGAVAATVIVGSVACLILALWAFRERDKADENALREAKARALADQYARDEAKARAQTDFRLYAYHLAAADRAIFEKDMARARFELAECEVALRGWEWHYLRRLSYDHQFPIDAGRAVTAVAFSPEDKGTLAFATDRDVRIYSRSMWQPLYSLPGHWTEAFSLAFTSDGQRLVAVGAGWTEFPAVVPQVARIWEVRSGEEGPQEFGNDVFLRAEENPRRGSLRAAFSPNGFYLACAGEQQTVRVWDTKTRKEVATLRGHTAAMLSMAFLSDDQLVSVSVAGEVKLWEWKTGKATDLPHQAPAYCAAFRSDGKRLAIAGADDNVRVLDLPGRTIVLKQTAVHVHCLALSNVGDFLATAGVPGDPTRPDELKVWHIGHEPELYNLRGHASRVHCVSFSPNGRLLASGGSDGFVMIWDPTPSRKRMIIPDGALLQQNDARDVTSQNGRFRAEVRDREIRLIPLEKVEEPLVLRHSFPIVCVAFSRDGRRLASVDRDHRVTLWDVQTGYEALIFSNGNDTVTSLEFSDDGNQLRCRVSEKEMVILDATPLERPDGR